MAPVLREIYDQMPEPKWVIAMGDCASCGGVFNNYALVQGVDKIVPVDVYVPGCPPTPEALLDSLIKLKERIADRQPQRPPRHRDQRRRRHHARRRPHRRSDDRQRRAAAPSSRPAEISLPADGIPTVRVPLDGAARRCRARARRAAAPPLRRPDGRRPADAAKTASSWCTCSIRSSSTPGCA